MILIPLMLMIGFGGVGLTSSLVDHYEKKWANRIDKTKLEKRLTLINIVGCIVTCILVLVLVVLSFAFCKK